MIEEKLIFAHLFRLFKLAKSFEIEGDNLGIDIGALLMQERSQITYFSKKQSRVALNYSTYDNELYVLVCTLKI